jgi:putative hydrolase of the HAD superfamily
VPAIALVAFDLDDTLYPERAFVRSGFRVVSDYLQHEGVVDRPLLADFEAAFDAGVRGNVFDRVLRAAGIEPDAALVRSLVEAYRSHRSRHGFVRPGIRLFDDADRALGRLAGQGIRLGLVSDGPLAAQAVKVETLGLAARMDAVILTDTWGPAFWKPHPRAFVEVARRLAIEPRACLYVADNPEKDFDGPAAAGWRPSVWVRRGEGVCRDAKPPEQRLLSATVASLDDLDGVLKGMQT